MNPSSRDAGIPVLTEIISPFAENDGQELDPRPILESTPASDAAPSAVFTHASTPPSLSDPNAFETQAVSRLSDEEWLRLERRIRERILAQILSSVDAALEQRIRDSLADVLQIALEGLTAQIRDGLHQSLEDIISHAISQEITRLQSTKK